MRVMGIIFANDVAVDALTEKRAMASLPFGGRYRQVDFHLSNLAAAGIRHVGLVSRSNSQSLITQHDCQRELIFHFPSALASRFSGKDHFDD